MNANQYMAAAIAAFLIGIGVCVGYLIWGQKDAIHEGYAAQVNQDDGSVVLSREPDGKATVPTPKIPKGHKIVRTIEATVSGGKPIIKPEIKTNNSGRDGLDVFGKVTSEVTSAHECKQASDFTCPPVTVRIDLLRDPHGTYRAQVSSSTGEILDGVDIPREPIATPIRHNAVTIASDGGRNGAGLYERKVWRGLSLGGGVIVYEGNAAPVGSVRLDW